MQDIQLLHGDCLELMKDIPDGSIDMILCDLPYGTTACKWDIVIPFNRHIVEKRGERNIILYQQEYILKRLNECNCSYTEAIQEFNDIAIDGLWQHYERIIKDNGVIALTSSQPFTSSLIMSNKNMFKHEWIWIKNRGSNFANTVREPMKEHESICVFSYGKWTYNKQMQERAGGGLDRVKYDFNCISNSENYRNFERPPDKQGDLRVPSSWQKFNVEVGFHPTQKPVSLFEYLIKTYSNEGDLILDNASGSATTAIAAVNTNRRCICIEKGDNYFEVGKKRVEEHIKSLQGKLFI